MHVQSTAIREIETRIERAEKFGPPKLPPGVVAPEMFETFDAQVRLMRDGVTIVDPGATTIDADVAVGRDTVIAPGTQLLGTTRVGERCQIGVLVPVLAQQSLAPLCAKAAPYLSMASIKVKVKR